LFLTLAGQPTPLQSVAIAACLSLWFDLLTFAVPINLGTLEGSRIVVLKLLGCQALLGMTFGMAIRAAQLFWACFGLVSYAWLTFFRKEPVRGTSRSAAASSVTAAIKVAADDQSRECAAVRNLPRSGPEDQFTPTCA
jgi:hypothetical protein